MLVKLDSLAIAVALGSIPLALTSTIPTSLTQVLGRRANTFTCPSPMSYSPWTRSCSCAPGQHWDDADKNCVGSELKGAWPEPSTAVYKKTTKAKLSTFCAASPYEIAEYDEDHEYCQASINTITFCAPREVALELRFGDGNIDVDNNISKGLKKVCGGLNGIYLKDVEDAVKLFNSGSSSSSKSLAEYGLGNTPRTETCRLRHTPDCDEDEDDDEDDDDDDEDNDDDDEDDEDEDDCVSHCKEGCGNFLDVIGGAVGGILDGLNGLCIVDGLVNTIDSVGDVVSDTVDGLLCAVQGVLGSLLGKLGCKC